VSLTRFGSHQAAFASSLLSPIFSAPEAFAKKIASLIFRPDRLFLPLTSFQSFKRPSLIPGSSSLISRCKHSLALSPALFLPPGNIQSLSRRRRTSSTRPLFAATSFDDLAIPDDPISSIISCEYRMPDRNDSDAVALSRRLAQRGMGSTAPTTIKAPIETFAQGCHDHCINAVHPNLQGSGRRS
jgi:hypothetical protein